MALPIIARLLVGAAMRGGGDSSEDFTLVSKGSRSGLYITDYEDLIRKLNTIQPALVKELRKDYRKIAKPVQAAVKSAIPLNPPTSGVHKKPRGKNNRPQKTISGFYPRVVPGRLSWGANSQNRNKQARSVGIQTFSGVRARRNMKYNKMTMGSIARLKVDSAATVMADLAGSSRKYIDKKSVTREYEYSRSATGKRIHRINGQGRSMITALNRNNNSSTRSRFVYPAAEKSIPSILPKMRSTLQRAYNDVNRRMAA
jgi:hypothetical protein